MKRPRPAVRLTTPVLLLTLIALGCSGGEYALEQDVPLTISVTSPAYEEDGRFPHQYTCHGEDLSPPLEWTGVPEGAMSIAVVFEDLDGALRNWAHWLLYGVPPDGTGFEEGASNKGLLPTGAKEGTNDDKIRGYGSPCLGSIRKLRGSGGTTKDGTPAHRFVFTVYALDMELDLAPGATRYELLRAIDGSILAGGKLAAKYARGAE